MQGLAANLPVGAPLSLVALMVNLGIGVCLALLVRWHFERFGTTLSNRAEFGQVFPFILLTTILIITVVKSSLALSLGLVGALSIVRFRTPVKEPEELAYLFIAIAIGLGLGADQAIPTVVAAVIILAVIAALRWTRRDRDQKNLYLSLDWAVPSQAERPIQAFSEVIARHASVGDLRRVDNRNGNLEVTYFIDVPTTELVSSMLEDLQRSFPGIGVTFIDQNQIPSV